MDVFCTKEQWGQTAQYKEFEEKSKNWTKDNEAAGASEFMQIFGLICDMGRWIQITCGIF